MTACEPPGLVRIPLTEARSPHDSGIGESILDSA